MTIWVPGAKGLLGTAFGEIALSPMLLTGKEVDIGDCKAVLHFVKEHPEIDRIVNAAAFSLVDPAEVEREAAFRANALGPENLGLAAKEVGAHLVHISTDHVFWGDGKVPLKETDPVKPPNYYGETKLEGERKLLKVNADAAILRTSAIFGKGGRNFVAKLLEMLQSREEIQLTSDHWYRPTYVEDLVQVILKMRGMSGVYQYANRGEASKFTFGVAMRDEVEKLGLKVVTKRIVPVPGDAFPGLCKRPKYSVFDTTKIETAMQIAIRPWQEALREYLCGLFVPS